MKKVGIKERNKGEIYMGFDLGVFGDWLEKEDDLNIREWKVPLSKSREEIREELREANFDVAKNNLSSIKENIEFFKMFLKFILNNQLDMVGICLRKLEYLGFEFNGNINMFSSDKNDVLYSMIQCAYLLEKENSELNQQIYKSFLEKIEKMEEN